MLVPVPMMIISDGGWDKVMSQRRTNAPFIRLTPSRRRRHCDLHCTGRAGASVLMAMDREQVLAGFQNLAGVVCQRQNRVFRDPSFDGSDLLPVDEDFGLFVVVNQQPA